MDCPHCGNNIIDKKDNNKVKIRTSILIFEKSSDGESFEGGGVICKSCGGFVKIPILLDQTDEKVKHIIIQNKN